MNRISDVNSTVCENRRMRAGACGVLVGRRLRRRLCRTPARQERGDDRQPGELHALHADAARARRARSSRGTPSSPCGRCAPMPSSCSDASPHSTRTAPVQVETPDAGAFVIAYEQLVLAVCSPPTFPFPVSPSMRSAWAISPTRSSCATGSCGSSRPRTPRSRAATEARISASSSSAQATQASRRSPSWPTSSPTRSAGTRGCAAPGSGGCSSTRRRRSSPRSRRARRLRGEGALPARRRDPRRDDTHVVRRPRGRARTASGSPPGRSSGQQRQGEPGARRLRDAARRTRPGPRRRLPPRRGP